MKLPCRIHKPRLDLDWWLILDAFNEVQADSERIEVAELIVSLLNALPYLDVRLQSIARVKGVSL